MKALVDDSGKILIGSDGKVATDDCSEDCCGNCTLPDEDCPRVVCFEVNIDAIEVEGGGLSGDFVRVSSSPDEIGFYADYDAGEWVVYTVFAEARVPFAGDIAGSWHSISLQLKCELDSVQPSPLGNLIVDGVESGYWTFSGTPFGLGLGFPNIEIGSLGVAALSSHRSIRKVTLKDHDRTIHYLPNEFDIFTGGATAANDGTVRVDRDDTDDAYVQHSIDTFYLCCCPLSSIAVTVHVYGTCTKFGCEVDFDCTFSHTFTRTDSNGALPNLCGPLYAFQLQDLSCITCPVAHPDPTQSSVGEINFTTAEGLSNGFEGGAFSVTFFGLCETTPGSNCGCPEEPSGIVFPTTSFTWTGLGTYNFSNPITIPSGGSGSFTTDVTFVFA